MKTILTFIIYVALNFFSQIVSASKLIKKHHTYFYFVCLNTSMFFLVASFLQNKFYIGCWVMWYLGGFCLTVEEKDLDKPTDIFNLLFYANFWPYTVYRYGWLGSKHKKPIRPKKPRGK